MHEFNLIKEYFTWTNFPSDVSVAVGDDAAVLNIPPNQQLVTSIDTLISGVHFPENTPPHAIGHKVLAVNLSDLAAMGATPKWFTLALTLPEVNPEWLTEFSHGLKQLAQQHNCFLVGGDTTRGSLSISIQVMGLVETDKALLRSGANAGDKIYITGTLGDAAAGLKNIFEELELSPKDSVLCQQRLNYPTPRLVESESIRCFASSCIDVSDGLLQDLSHILESSGVGAKLDVSRLPLSPILKKFDSDISNSLALTGGDDYELLFTIPVKKESFFLEVMNHKIECIGVITEHSGQILDENNKMLSVKGYNHFE